MKGYTKYYYNGSQRLAAVVGDINELPDGMVVANASERLDNDKAKAYMDTISATDALVNLQVHVEENMLLPVLSKEKADSVKNYVLKENTYYYHGDHLGSASWITDGNGDIIEHRRYLPYGETWYEKRFGQSDYSERYKFTGKERDEESGYDYFGARYFDAMLLTSWMSVDPVVKYNESPYLYCGGNPMNAIDPWGMDSVQRQTAIARANEYVKQNPGKSYEWNAKGGPGEKVDCSGLVSNCIKAAGEQDPNYGPRGVNGVTNMANNTVEVGINEVEAGNMITFSGGKGKYSHVGLVTDVTTNDKGDVSRVDFIHSGSSNGPVKDYVLTTGKSYWTDKLTGFFKWDTYDAGQTKGVTIWGPPSPLPSPKISASPKISPNVSMIRMSGR